MMVVLLLGGPLVLTASVLSDTGTSAVNVIGVLAFMVPVSAPLFFMAWRVGQMKVECRPEMITVQNIWRTVHIPTAFVIAIHPDTADIRWQAMDGTQRVTWVTMYKSDYKTLKVFRRYGDRRMWELHTWFGPVRARRVY